MAIATPRQIAASIGESRYFTGVPCKRGHLAERRVSDGHCVECSKLKDTAERFREMRAKNGRSSQAASSAKHYERNKQARIKDVIDRSSRRAASDPTFALQLRIRSLIIQALKSRGLSKQSRTAHILGCSPSDFRRHIELQFVDGMSWENRSEWHLDHIVPLASAKSEEELILLNHYTNIRPLWSHLNLAKGARQETLI